LRMLERDVSRQEIAYALRNSISMKKDEHATPFPKEEISCQVGSRWLFVVIAVNHADEVRVVITVYAKEKKK
jgi:hypothetical protein